MNSSSAFCLLSRLHYRHDAGADRIGETGPRGDHGGQVRGIGWQAGSILGSS